MDRTDQEYMQLRQDAEARLERKQLKLVNPLPGEELLHHLMHEVSVHRIELEMQNETLRQAQIELEKSRDRYVELFDFAPVGYLTLNHDGMIEEINLVAANMLGVERSKLMHRRFAPFVAPTDRDRWHRHFLSVLNNADKKSCELLISKGDGLELPANFYCQRLEKDGQKPMVRVVLADISDRKQSETAGQEV